MEVIDKFAESITTEEIQKMRNLIFDLDWELYRMSESGAMTYEKLLTLICQVQDRARYEQNVNQPNKNNGMYCTTKVQ